MNKRKMNLKFALYEYCQCFLEEKDIDSSITHTIKTYFENLIQKDPSAMEYDIVLQYICGNGMNDQTSDDQFSAIFFHPKSIIYSELYSITLILLKHYEHLDLHVQLMRMIDLFLEQCGPLEVSMYGRNTMKIFMKLFLLSENETHNEIQRDSIQNSLDMSMRNDDHDDLKFVDINNEINVNVNLNDNLKHDNLININDCVIDDMYSSSRRIGVNSGEWKDFGEKRIMILAQFLKNVVILNDSMLHSCDRENRLKIITLLLKDRNNPQSFHNIHKTQYDDFKISKHAPLDLVENPSQKRAKEMMEALSKLQEYGITLHIPYVFQFCEHIIKILSSSINSNIKTNNNENINANTNFNANFKTIVNPIVNANSIANVYDSDFKNMVLWFLLSLCQTTWKEEFSEYFSRILKYYHVEIQEEICQEILHMLKFDPMCQDMQSLNMMFSVIEIIKLEGKLSCHKELLRRKFFDLIHE